MPDRCGMLWWSAMVARANARSITTVVGHCIIKIPHCYKTTSAHGECTAPIRSDDTHQRKFALSVTYLAPKAPQPYGHKSRSLM